MDIFLKNHWLYRDLDDMRVLSMLLRLNHWLRTLRGLMIKCRGGGSRRRIKGIQKSLIGLENRWTQNLSIFKIKLNKMSNVKSPSNKNIKLHPHHPNQCAKMTQIHQNYYSTLSKKWNPNFVTTAMNSRKIFQVWQVIWKWAITKL